MTQDTTHTPKRYWIPVVIVLLLAGIGFGVWYYFAGSPHKKEHVEDLIPHIKMSHIRITDIDGEHIKFLAHVSLNNPFPANISTKRIQYQVYIDTAMVIESDYSQPIIINKSDSSGFDMPMQASLKRMLAIFKTFETEHVDSADYKINAKAYLAIPVIGERSFNVDHTIRLPAILLPELKLTDTDIEKLGFKKSGVDLSFIVNNPNQFSLKLKDGRFKVTIDDNLEMEGIMKEMLIIPAKGSANVPIHFDIKTNKLGSMAWKVLFNKKNTHMNIVFTGVAKADHDMLDNTNLLITAEGTLQEILKTAKELR